MIVGQERSLQYFLCVTYILVSEVVCRNANIVKNYSGSIKNNVRRGFGKDQSSDTMFKSKKSHTQNHT